MGSEQQAAKSNRDALNFLHEEVTTLVNMLHRLAKAVETELPVDQYPVESGERYRTTEDAFRSAKLTKRVATLARWVPRQSWYRLRDEADRRTQPS